MATTFRETAGVTLAACVGLVVGWICRGEPAGGLDYGETPAVVEVIPPNTDDRIYLEVTSRGTRGLKDEWVVILAGDDRTKTSSYWAKRKANP